jgi:hypothetical protein
MWKLPVESNAIGPRNTIEISDINPVFLFGIRGLIGVVEYAGLIGVIF